MKNITTLLLITFLLFVYIKHSINAEIEVVISVTSHFDDENLNITTLLQDNTYASNLSLENTILNLEGYSFVSWIVNNSVRKELLLNHTFVLTNDMELIAIFSPSDKHSVLFMDSNSKLLNIQYVSHGEDAQDIIDDLPSKPGYIISTTNKWDGSLSNITQDTIFTLQYEKINTNTFNLSVIYGQGSDTYNYNDLVTIEADAPEPNEYFNYWKVDNQIVSSNPIHSFTIFSDMEIEAVYSNEPIFNPPMVSISSNLHLRDNYKTFVGQKHVPSGYTLIEYGMITSQINQNITLSSDDILKYQGLNHTVQSNEWMMSFGETNHKYVRAYLVLRNSQNEILIVYSDLDTIQSETEAYYTGFEGATKGSYTPALVNLNNESWMLSNALLGTTADDKKVDSQSVRIRDLGGFIETRFSTASVSKISFQHAMFGTHTGNSRLTVFVSKDLSNWIPVSTPITPSSSLQEFNVSIDYTQESLVTNNITKDSELYIKIEKTLGSNSGATINIDEFNIHQIIEEPYIPEQRLLLQLDATEDVDISVSETGPWYELSTSITITAPEIEGLVFLRWENVVTDQTESVARVYTFDITKHTYLKAIYGEDDGTYTLLVDQNIAGDHIQLSQEGPYAYNEMIYVQASSVSNYDFLYWLNVKTNQIYTYNQDFFIYTTDNYHIRAIYQEAHSLYYTTDFTGPTKSSYVVGNLTLNNQSWTFDNAVLATVDSNRVARIRQGGFIQTQFAVSDVTQITFSHRVTSETATGKIRLQFSTNGLSWTDLSDAILSSSNDYSMTVYDLDLFSLWENGYFASSQDIYVRIFNSYTSNIEINNFILFNYSNFVGFPLKNYESNVLTFDFQSPFVTVLSLGDTWSPNVCYATDLILGDVPCQVEGTVNTSIRGRYEITYSAVDSNGTTVLHKVSKDVITDASLLGLTLSSYYRSIEGLYGLELEYALRSLLMNMTFITYGDVRFALENTDLLYEGSDELQLYYLDATVPAIWDEGNTWNREHVWPASRLPVARPDNSTRDMGSDLHNLVPENPTVNSFRSNNPFDYNPLGTSNPYEVRDPSKGNIARIIFYMFVRYDMLTLVEANPLVEEHEMGILSTLIDWHYFDEVDAFEMRRNQVIYEDYQGNRNPFIDYPHLVELLFFDHPNIPNN